MADTPLGVPAGDASPDGCAPLGVVVSVADKLRTLAEWLDAHPGVRIDDVSFFAATEVEARNLSFDSLAELQAEKARIGGSWRETGHGSLGNVEKVLVRFEQEIMPGYFLKLVGWPEKLTWTAAAA